MRTRLLPSAVVVATLAFGMSALAQERGALERTSLTERVQKSEWSDASWRA